MGKVINDFGNLEEVAPLLGISSDINPQIAAAPEPQFTPYENAPAPYDPVTLEEAQGYAEAQERTRYRLGIATALFVMSPALLISAPLAAEAGFLGITPDAATFVGLLALAVLVVTGVLMIMSTSRETAPYARLTEGRFSANPTVTRWAETVAEPHERTRMRALQIAIALWIFAPIPLIGFTLLMGDSGHSDFWAVLGVVLVLAFVAAGLLILLPTTWAHTVAQNLGSKNIKYGDTAAEERGIVGVVAAFYWPLLTAAFLAWSFIGNAWHISWVIWPIGAVLFTAFSAGLGAIENYRRARS